MRKPVSGKTLASEILSRSSCSVQVGAAIADHHGIHSWGWNSSGPDGFGQCAEQHAILRANRKRLRGATIYVASVRRRNEKIVISKPCEKCQKLINKWNLHVLWRDSDGDWRMLG
jgi:deoxycytidylate deaminase